MRCVCGHRNGDPAGAVAPSMSDLTANIVGTAAAICSITSFAPQALKIWKERDASSVSFKTYSLTVTCFILWVIYGAMTQSLAGGGVEQFRPGHGGLRPNHEVAIPRR